MCFYIKKATKNDFKNITGFKKFRFKNKFLFHQKILKKIPNEVDTFFFCPGKSMGDIAFNHNPVLYYKLKKTKFNFKIKVYTINHKKGCK
jgi:hypothetical protein